MTHRAGSPAAAQRIDERRARRIRRAHDDQPDAHVERPQHVVVGHAAGPLQPLEERRHPPRRASIARVRCPAGSMRGRLSVMPPPVMCAMPLMQPGRRAAAGSTDRYERCGASSASPIVRPSSGTTRRRRSSPATRTRSGARASSRWCAGRTRAAPISTSPGAMPRAVDQPFARDTTPTMKPATSYSPSA